jgi:hypothetical protein
VRLITFTPILRPRFLRFAAHLCGGTFDIEKGYAIMVKRLSLVCAPVVLALGLLVSAAPARAVTLFDATILGVNQFPVNGSAATGYGTVLLNDAMDQITVNESWAGLSAPATASHIHTAPAGTNGPVTFPFAGVPHVTSGSITEQVFAINATQLANLQAGNMYFNIHTSTYPGGEIRGQIAPVPEPGSMALLLSAGPGALLMLRRRRNA